MNFWFDFIIQQPLSTTQLGTIINTDWEPLFQGIIAVALAICFVWIYSVYRQPIYAIVKRKPGEERKEIIESQVHAMKNVGIEKEDIATQLVKMLREAKEEKAAESQENHILGPVASPPPMPEPVTELVEERIDDVGHDSVPISELVQEPMVEKEEPKKEPAQNNYKGSWTPERRRQQSERAKANAARRRLEKDGKDTEKMGDNTEAEE